MSNRVKDIIGICATLTVLIVLTIIFTLSSSHEQVVLTEVTTSTDADAPNNLDDKVAEFISEEDVFGTMNTDLLSGYVGNIIVADTDISFPVMYSTNPYYYTQHNSNNNVDSDGAIFIDYRVESFIDRVILIHGLSPVNGGMFSSLENFLDEDWAEAHNAMSLKLESDEYNYELLCVVEMYQNEPIVRLNCKSDSSYQAFYEELIKNSKYVTDIDFNVNKQLVILNTVCNDRHLLVCFLEV